MISSVPTTQNAGAGAVTIHVDRDPAVVPTPRQLARHCCVVDPAPRRDGGSGGPGFLKSMAFLLATMAQPAGDGGFPGSSQLRDAAALREAIDFLQSHGANVFYIPLADDPLANTMIAAVAMETARSKRPWTLFCGTDSDAVPVHPDPADVIGIMMRSVNEESQAWFDHLAQQVDHPNIETLLHGPHEGLGIESRADRQAVSAFRTAASPSMPDAIRRTWWARLQPIFAHMEDAAALLPCTTPEMMSEVCEPIAKALSATQVPVASLDLELGPVLVAAPRSALDALRTFADAQGSEFWLKGKRTLDTNAEGAGPTASCPPIVPVAALFILVGACLLPAGVRALRMKFECSGKSRHPRVTNATEVAAPRVANRHRSRPAPTADRPPLPRYRPEPECAVAKPRVTDPERIALDCCATVRAFSGKKDEVLPHLLRGIAREVRPGLLGSDALELARSLAVLCGFADALLGSPLLTTAMDRGQVDYAAVLQLVNDRLEEMNAGEKGFTELQSALAMFKDRGRLLGSAGQMSVEELSRIKVFDWQARRMARATAATEDGKRTLESAAPAERAVKQVTASSADVFVFAKSLARSVDPSAPTRLRGLLLAGDLFIPGPARVPHLHVTKDFAVFKKADGTHYELVSGSRLLCANVDAAITHLGGDDPPQASVLRQFLDGLAAFASNPAN